MTVATAPAAAPAGPRLGLIFDEPEDVYRASGALGSTEIRNYLINPDGFRLRHVDKHPLAQFNGSDSTELGTQVHLLLQGEDHYRARQIIVPDEFLTERGISTSKAAKAWLAEHVTAGKRAMTPAEDAKVRFLVDRVRANPVALRLMTGAKAEVTARLRDPHTGLLLQARFDVFHDEWNCDYKTTSAPIRSFKWSVRDYLLHVQAAIYDAIRVGVCGGARLPFLWIVQSTVWPFECRVVECAEALLNVGMGEVDRALSGIAAKEWGQPQTEPDVLEAVAG